MTNTKRKASSESSQRGRDKLKELKAEARDIQAAELVGNETGCVTPQGRVPVVPDKYGSINCKCIHCTLNKKIGNRYTVNHWAYKTAAELEKHEVNRLAMPGDVDYQIDKPKLDVDDMLEPWEDVKDVIEDAKWIRADDHQP